MNKDMGSFAQRVRGILQAWLPQIKPEALAEVAERIDTAAKDSVEIRDYWEAERKDSPDA